RALRQLELIRSGIGQGLCLNSVNVHEHSCMESQGLFQRQWHSQEGRGSNTLQRADGELVPGHAVGKFPVPWGHAGSTEASRWSVVGGPWLGRSIKAVP
ncbi:MAG: hypothetical protein WCJ28_06715, partial [Actinomycetota bacterium]